jgi:type II secretory pathway component PulL
VEIHEADQRAILAGGGWGGFSIEPALAPALAARWLARLNEAPARIALSGGRAEAWRTALGEAGGKLAVRGEVDAMAELARGVVDFPAYAPNLRQGAFASDAQKPSPWRLWRLAAVLAVLALFLHVGMQVAWGVRDQIAAQNIYAQAERDLVAARPDLEGARNLRAQVRSLVNAQTQARQHPVLRVNEALVRAHQNQPLVRLDELRHQSPERTVRLRVSSPQQPALQAFITELQGAGAQVESQVLQPQSGRYSAELSMESP